MSDRRAGPPPVQPATGDSQKDRLAVVVREVNSRSEQFAALLGPENVERWKTVALHALAQNTNVLRNCTPTSIVEAIRESAALNLSPTGLLGEGWIVPYKDKAQFQPGYRGFLKLLRNSGQIKTVDSQIVYMGDEFTLSLGTAPAIHHVPLLYGEKDEEGDNVADRGDYRGVYAYVVMLSGETVIEWMSWDDVVVVRAKSPSVQRGQPSPWDDFPGEMARKSVLKRLMKRLPLDSMPKVAAAAILDEQGDVLAETTYEPVPASARATAAAYALGHGSTDDASEPQTASDAPVEDAGLCRLAGPDKDYGHCILPLDHEGLHKDAQGQTWAVQS